MVVVWLSPKNLNLCEFYLDAIYVESEKIVLKFLGAVQPQLFLSPKVSGDSRGSELVIKFLLYS